MLLTQEPSQKGGVLFVLSFVFLDKVSLCIRPSCPGTHFVDQAGLEHTEICLPQAPSAGIKGMSHRHCQAKSGVLEKSIWQIISRTSSCSAWVEELGWG